MGLKEWIKDYDYFDSAGFGDIIKAPVIPKVVALERSDDEGY
jgi:hypothetical protein